MPARLPTTILCALIFFATSSAHGQAIDAAIFYQIVAKHSGKCLDVSGGPGAVANGVPVIQWECGDGDNQKWKITPVGDGYYKIVAKHSGRGLDVFGGVISTANGVVVAQWDYNGHGNQMWKMVSVGDGYYDIVAKHSGKSLDINGGPGATANGARAQQWDWVNGDNQKFRLAAARGCVGADAVTSTFRGTARLRIPRARSDEIGQDLELPIRFTDCRVNIGLDFPTLRFTYSVDLPNGPAENTTTVRQIGTATGRFDPASGRVDIAITLLFQHSLPAVPSNIILNLSTEGPAGQRLQDGNVTLGGSGQFTGGYMNGWDCSTTVAGRFTPSP